VQHVQLDPPPPPPPDQPELPEGAAPRWPAWYAGVGFLVALVATLVVVGIFAAATGTTSDDEDATFTIVATFLQGMIFIGTAVLFASFTRTPRAEHFGLRPTRFWQAVGWAALGLFCFYLLAFVYTVIVQPDAEQTVAQDLGADQGTFGLIAAGFMVICVAPVAEEFFFRGFFYRALRSRWSVLGAATIDGLLFGVIHYDFSGADALLILPPLAVLGFTFCLVYERTGSLYPVIALHAFNNAIAYGATVEDASVSLVLGPLMLLGCALVPWIQQSRLASTADGHGIVAR
jgi:membrane protease YdiL (CAAX protease family)